MYRVLSAILDTAKPALYGLKFRYALSSSCQIIWYIAKIRIFLYSYPVGVVPQLEVLSSDIVVLTASKISRVRACGLSGLTASRIPRHISWLSDDWMMTCFDCDLGPDEKWEPPVNLSQEF